MPASCLMKTSSPHRSPRCKAARERHRPCWPCAQDMAAFVDAAHGLGMGVMMDVVLHHGAPAGNMLWYWDGWEEGHNGGIYHEGAPDCMWGRQWAFWKAEVRALGSGSNGSGPRWSGVGGC
jgi:hypothetical protein